MNQALKLAKPQSNHDIDWLTGLEILQGDFEALAALMLKTVEELGLSEHSHQQKVLNLLVCTMHQKSDELEEMLKQKNTP